MSTSAQDETASNRILAALEAGNCGTSDRHKHKSRFGRGRIIAVSLLVLAGLAAWIAYQNKHMAILDGFNSPKEEILPIAEHAAPPVENEPAPIKLTESKIGEKAAVITNDPAPKNVSTEVATDESANNPGTANPLSKQAPVLIPDAGSKTPTGELLKSLERPDTTAGPALTKSVATVPAAHQITASKKPNDAARAIQKPSARQTSQASSAKSDTDVALLTALMAAGVEPEQVRTAAPKVKKIHAKAGQPNRDIVERTTGDSSQTLLTRCKQLGFLEGELCRWRICSGRWDTDLACKVF